MFHFRYRLQNNQPVPVCPPDAQTGLLVSGGWYHGTAPATFDFPEGYDMEEITEAQFQAVATDAAIEAAERFIDAHFSTPRLLQMKVWWDTFPHEATPKLAATYQWTDAVTRAAISGDKVFSDPPHTFAEIAQEIIQLGE